MAYTHIHTCIHYACTHTGSPKINGTGLELIGKNCTKLSEFQLHMTSQIEDSPTGFLHAFAHIQSLSIQTLENNGIVTIIPPSNMNLWVRNN